MSKAYSRRTPSPYTGTPISKKIRWTCAVAVAALCCTGCGAPAEDSLAGFIRGDWECASEDLVADGDLYPRFTVGESDLVMIVTNVGEDMSGSGNPPATFVDDPVRLTYRVDGDTIVVDTDRGVLEIQVAAVIPDSGDVPLLLNGESGYTAEIDGRSFRVVTAEDSEGRVGVVIRCE